MLYTAAHHSFLSGHLYQFPIALVLNNPMNIVVCGNKQKIIHKPCTRAIYGNGWLNLDGKHPIILIDIGTCIYLQYSPILSVSPDA